MLNVILRQYKRKMRKTNKTKKAKKMTPNQKVVTVKKNPVMNHLQRKMTMMNMRVLLSCTAT